MTKFTLVGKNGNAYCLMGYTEQCMKKTGFSSDEIEAVMEDAKSSDYNHLIVALDNAIQKCNERLEQSPDFDGWDEDEDEEW